MKLTKKQTDKILEKLKDYGYIVIDINSTIEKGAETIDEEYFWEKINEALEK